MHEIANCYRQCTTKKTGTIINKKHGWRDNFQTSDFQHIPIKYDIVLHGKYLISWFIICVNMCLELLSSLSYHNLEWTLIVLVASSLYILIVINKE